jgi:hypothetical protein
MKSNNKTRILRTSIHYWLLEIGALTLILVIVPVIAIIFKWSAFYLRGGIGIVIGLILLFRNFIPAYRAKIEFTPFELRGMVEKVKFSEAWEDIQAVSFSGEGNTSLMTLWTEEHVLQIPSYFFNKKELEQLLRKHLPERAFHPLAYQSTDQFQEWQEARRKQFDTLHAPIKVSLGKTERSIGIFTLILGFLMGVLFFNADKAASLVMFSLFGGLGLALIVFSTGSIEANSYSIKHRMLFREYEMIWNSMDEVYISSAKSVIALVSQQCRIVLPSPSNWSGKDKKELLGLIDYKIETRRIQPIESTKHLIWQSKLL